MKKQLLTLFLGLLGFNLSAQTALPNGSFESWTSATYEYPQYFPGNSNPEAFFRFSLPFNVTKSTDAFSGSFALQLKTNASATDTSFGYIANPDNINGSGGPASWTGGIPMTQKPLGIHGHYKYNVATADSALIIVVARQGGTTIGAYTYLIGGVQATYVPFNFVFSPALAVIPDSVIVAFASSNAMAGQGIPGSTLLLDSVSFNGITTQPAQLNGDFELWQTQLVEKPNSWYLNNGDAASATKTTDKYAGAFAMSLQTYLGDNNGTPRAQGSEISTGYWDETCSCQKGGYPFTNQVDTLAFYYKYAPMASDSAYVNLSFKNSGVNIYNTGKYIHTAATYQYAEIPFNLGTTPDSVIITVSSSAWQDSTLTFVGSVLKIDEMQFKTQPLSTAINNINAVNDVNFYPNPFKTTGTIVISPDVNTEGMILNVYDFTGRVVKVIKTNDHKFTIDRNEMVNGIYFYELKTNNKLIKTGKIVVE